MLEVNGKKGEAPPNLFGRARAAGKGEELQDLPAILLAVAVIGEDGINEVVFLGFGGGVFCEGKERRNGPGVSRVLLLRIEEGASGFSS